MNREQITETLKVYLAYKHAVNMYERHQPIPSAGVANYSAMPSGSGAPERFFAIVGKPADMGHTSLQDVLDYRKYKAAVTELEGAFAVLTEDEESVIKLKWIHDLDLSIIAERKKYSVITIKRWHKRALDKLETALRFAQFPVIETHQYAKVDTL